MRPSEKMEDSSRYGRRDGMVSRTENGPIVWFRSSPPGWTESTENSAFTWRKRSQAMAVSTCTWGALKRETRRSIASAIPLWIIASGPSPWVARPGWTGLPRRLGEGSFSSPGWRSWSVKPNRPEATGGGFRANGWRKSRIETDWPIG